MKRLKVYGAPIGFYDVIVAAANQGEALAAWGVRQNLFAEGAAHVVEDAAAVEAARARPGEVLRRPIGADQPFALEPRTLPELPAEKRSKQRGAGQAKAKALAAAESALAALEADWKGETIGLAKARAALDEKASVARAAYLDRRKAAKSAVAAARKSLGRSSG